MSRTLLFIIPFLLFVACIRKENHAAIGIVSEHPTDSITYARGFTMQSSAHQILITVINPWQHAANIRFHYLLSDTLASSSRKDEYNWQIKTPVKRVICLSTTHIGFIDFINMEESVCGISGKDYVVNDKIRQKISEGTAFDVGYDENLNYEQIIKLKPDLVFAYGVSVAITNMIKKLNELGIPVIMIGEYLEQVPLAKMEWIKVFGACYGMGNQVKEKFDSVAIRYKSLCDRAAKETEKPTVLLGLPWMGNWYISGSKSYTAQLIKDAGGKYVFDYLNFNESRPLGLEIIYEKALAAQYWINPGEARSINDIVSVDKRFGSLPSIKRQNVYNNDKQRIISGGNAFYESGSVEPDRILSDLIYILHPQLLPSHKLTYYRILH
jgi:iron complex transport system substrate-binding protein